MKKIYDLWEYFAPPSGKIDSSLKILFLAILISFLNVRTLPAKSNADFNEFEANAQQVAVTGIVTDAANGEAIPGVNVMLKGTTIGVITDASGKYSISAGGKNATLVFSFIGFVTQEVAVSGKGTINIALVSDTKDIDEVVIVGYSSVKKESLTGAISAIKTSDILTTKTTSVASMVQGKVPGLMIRKLSGEPGTFSSMISVRGFGTPLLVLDGVVRDGMSDFERLNPNDIESISVLKDASAAIYGMNSDNGVLIVTTKSGSRGRTKIAYDGTYTWKQPTSTDLQQTVDAYTYRMLKNEASRNAGQPEPYSAAELEKWRIGTEPGYTDFNWYDAVLSDHVTTQQHNFSISGGNDAVTHYTSFGYMDDQGLYTDNRTMNYQKYNIRTSFDAKLAKGLKARVIFAGKYDNRYTPGGNSYFWLFKQTVVSDRGIGPYTLANPTHYTTVPAENVNPLAQITKEATGYTRNQNYQYQFTTELNYELPFVKGLSFGLLAAFDGNTAEQKQLRKYPILYDYKTDAPGAASKAYMNDNITIFNRGDIQAKISYKNTIAQDHNVSGFLVYEYRRLSTRNVRGQRNYDDVYTWPILDQASATNQTTSGGLAEEAYISYLGRLNYDFRNKYLLELIFREDGSYRYAPDKRWAFFPAATFGWRISEEPFLKDKLPMISNLKLRGSYGSMGADAGNAYQYVPGYKLSGTSGGAVLSPGVLTLGMIPPGVINENLSWINTTTADIGIDLELWKGKLGFVADVFRKSREGLLATRATSVPNTFGATFPQENLNSDHFKGFEAEVSHRNKYKDITYSVSANVTYARQYLDYVERSPYTNTMAIWKDGSAGMNRIQGRKWLYEYDGVFTNVTQFETAPLQGGTNGNSKPLLGEPVIRDINGDGVINSNDQMPNTWTNTSNPPLQFGMNFYASWKGFDINMLLQGASMFSYPINKGDMWGYRTYPSAWTYWLDRWHQADITVDPHDPAAVWIPGKYEALMNSTSGTTIDNGTSIWNPKANYMRIKNLEIGYTVPASFSRRIFVEKLRLSLNVVNLATFCSENLKRFDPERSVGEYDAGGTYPLLREFNFGLSANF
jgi:TonB-linked SusC/RagA family outer membrane protein